MKKRGELVPQKRADGGHPTSTPSSLHRHCSSSPEPFFLFEAKQKQESEEESTARSGRLSRAEAGEKEAAARSGGRGRRRGGRSKSGWSSRSWIRSSRGWIQNSRTATVVKPLAASMLGRRTAGVVGRRDARACEVLPPHGRICFT